MKRNFIKIVSALAVSAAVLTACEKPDNDGNGDNGGGTTPAETPESLKGSEYALIYMGDTAVDTFLKSKKVTDLRVDDTSNFLYVWEGTYEGAEADGLNLYKVGSDYLSLTVGNVGWSGAGFCAVDHDLQGFAKANELNQWTFHIAYKSSQTNRSHLCTVIWAGTEYKFALGDANWEDGTKPIAPVTGQYEQFVWNEYEIPVSEMGLNLSASTTGNYFTVLSGGTPGTELNLDAIFFYKK